MAGGWLTPRPGRFIPWKETRYSFYSRLGGPQGRSGRVWKISPPPGSDARSVQPVVSHCNDWDTLTHYLKIISVNEWRICIQPWGWEQEIAPKALHLSTRIYTWICLLKHSFSNSFSVLCKWHRLSFDRHYKTTVTGIASLYRVFQKRLCSKRYLGICSVLFSCVPHDIQDRM